MTKNFCTFAVQNPRKDAGVVDRDGLENRCTLTGTQGSNPCLSAKKQPSRLLFCIWKDGMRTLEGSLPRSALRSRDSLSFRKKAALKAAFFGSSRKFGAFDSCKLKLLPSNCRDMPSACEAGVF